MLGLLEYSKMYIPKAELDLLVYCFLVKYITRQPNK